MTIMQLWFEILKFANGTSFDISDPLFNMDISFYIFKLDFLTQLNEILIGVIIGFIILTVIYYIILMTVRTPDVFKEEVPPDAQPPADGEIFWSSIRLKTETRRLTTPTISSANSARRLRVNIRPDRKKPKKQFGDTNFKQLMHIASGKDILLGFIFFIMLGLELLPSAVRFASSSYWSSLRGRI